MKHVRNNDLTVEATASVPQVVEYLEQLAAALKAGAVHVHVGAQEIVLGPRGVLGLKLRARQKGKRQKLALELTWRKKLVSPDEGLGLRFAAAPVEAPPEAIEVGDDAEVSAEVEAAAEATEVAGEAHEGELATTSADDETSA